jgi:small-conductance mechanosensitive channel
VSLTGPPAVADDHLCPEIDPLNRLCGWIDGQIPSAGPAISRILGALVVVVGVTIAGRVVRRLVDRGLERTSADRQVRNLLHNLLSVATIVLAILGGLSALGLSFSVLVTSFGLTGLAVGLALQDLLRNILAGIFLLIERPFRIGDWITVGDHSGSVQTIQLRTTALRTADGQLAILPNLTAFAGTVVNATAFDVRRFSVAVRPPPGADLEQALRTARQVVEQAEGVAKEPPPFVQPRIDVDGGVTITVRYWLEYRSHDPDAVAASLVAALYTALGPWPAPDGQRPPDGTAVEP